jgi:phosphoribosylpyrophosphate synthetase
VAACVERRHEVPGSHRRRRRGRPGVPRERQRRSMGWSGDLPAGDIWLVDDVLTTGQTLQAAADVLQAQCGKRPVGYLVAAVAMYTPVPAEVLWVDRIKKTSRDPGEQQGPR